MILSRNEYLIFALVTYSPWCSRLFTTTPAFFQRSSQTDCKISFTGIYVVVTDLRAHNARITADLPSVEIWAQWCLYKMLAFKATLDKIGSRCSFSPLFPAPMFWDKISFTPYFSEGPSALILLSLKHFLIKVQQSREKRKGTKMKNTQIQEPSLHGCVTSLLLLNLFRAHSSYVK